MADYLRKEIRREMRGVLASLDGRWLRAASSELCRNLDALVSSELGSNIDHILAWTKFFPGEPDLSNFIGGELEHRQVYLPRTLPDWSMNFIAVGKNWGEIVEAGDLGILEPAGGAGEQFDLNSGSRAAVIVPGLAFDIHGNRLGRGKGYYDRFLAQDGMQEAIKIGVGWSLQQVESIPVRNHDIAMDWICTEHGFRRAEK